MTPTAADPDPAAAVTGSSPAMRALFTRVLRETVLATAGIAVVGLVAGYLVAGRRGLLGALLGVLAALIFSGTTALSVRAGLGKPPTLLAALVLGAWLGKMIAIVALLAIIDGQTWYDRYVFAAVLFAVVLTSAVIDVRAVLQARIPNAEQVPDNRGG